MSATTFSPECTLQMHPLCAGPKTIRRKGAPAWEVPMLTLRCDCLCHGRLRPNTPKTGATT
ncbi:hypothetical protein AB0L99_42490 [Streptomyces sp. NPDC051954]|uniref:hypothetical protein n=1 Tax=Streptomyces sp. NPDC051954 TaxID=3155524 RepID=UPI003437B00B